MPFSFIKLLPFDEHSRGDAKRAQARWPARVALGLGAVSLIGLALLAGCGGGGGGTSAASSTSTSSSGTVSSGSTTTATTLSAAAVTEGTITGFGSVIVNGVRFDSESCSVVDDSGASATVDQLKLGMRVEVSSGTVDSATSSAKALKISFGSRVIGPVTLLGSSTLSILGQTIDIVDATVFDSSTLPNGLSDITEAKVIEVHGLPDAATGHILATRLHAPASVSAYKLRGAISALDTSAQTLSIGSTSISYAGVTLTPSTLALATGLVVRVTLPTTLTTTSVQPYAATAVSAPGRASSSTPLAAHVRGTVAAYDATLKTFTLDGLKVDASAITTLPAGLADGVEVDVLGSVSNSVLVATAVTLKTEARGKDGKRFELHGTISGVTATSFVLRGITVDYSAMTAAGYLPSGKTAADLIAGAKVEVKGTVDSTRTKVVASSIQFER